MEQVFDRGVADDVADRVENLLGAQDSRGGDRRIQQPQDCPLGQSPGPVGELVELARRVQPADQRAPIDDPDTPTTS